MSYEFDRFLRYDELTAWLHELAAAHPQLVGVESYGRSHEGRELWLVTVTDAATGAHDIKPAHWVDASIHATELTGTVAACYLLHHLVTGHTDGDPTVREALATRTFYVVPRSTPMAPNGRSLIRLGSAGRAPGHGRGPTGIAGRARTSRTWTATAVCCRCGSRIRTALGCRIRRTPGC